MKLERVVTTPDNHAPVVDPVHHRPGRIDLDQGPLDQAGSTLRHVIA